MFSQPLETGLTWFESKSDISRFNTLQGCLEQVSGCIGKERRGGIVMRKGTATEWRNLSENERERVIRGEKACSRSRMKDREREKERHKELFVLVNAFTVRNFGLLG